MTQGYFRLPKSDFAAFNDRISALITDPAAADTPRQLCDALKLVIEVDHTAAFVLHRDTAPSRLFDDVESEPIEYAKSPYLFDPIYYRYLDGSVPEFCRMRDMWPDAFTESEYWNIYYKHLDFVDEIYLNIPITGGSLFHINLVRTGDGKRYTAAELELGRSLLPIARAILTAHAQSGAGEWEHNNASADAYHQRLNSVFENFGRSVLTDREKQVVDLTMRGYSDKLTARELDITPGTVRNHKKSIFSKFEISSQGQLFGLFLEALELPA